MNIELIRELVKLRYKLLWAKTRSRNGKIALFMAGYLLLVCLLALLLAGGFGAGYAAVRSGKAEGVAQAVLTVVYLQALLATVILGFGMNAVFSDAELRRYPLRAVDRLAARHFIGIADPFWFLFLALELGLLVGLYLFGAAGFWLGLIAVVLLLVSNYLVARVLALVVERLMQRKSGPALLMLFIMSFAILPSVIAPKLSHSKGALAAIKQTLGYTPGFGAAAAMAGSGARTFSGLALLAVWVVAAAAVLMAQLTRLDALRAKREEHAAYLTAGLKKIPGLMVQENYPQCTRRNYYVFGLRFDPDHFSGMTRSKFIEAMHAEGIPVGAGQGPPIYNHPFMDKCLSSRGFRKVFPQERLERYRAEIQCPTNDKLCATSMDFGQEVLIGTKTDVDDVLQAAAKVQKYAATAS